MGQTRGGSRREPHLNPVLPEAMSAELDLTDSFRLVWISDQRQFAGAVSKSGCRGIQTIEQTQVEIRHGGLLVDPYVTACFQGTAAFTSEQDREIVVGVSVTIGNATSDDDHAIVQKGAIAFLDVL